MRGLDVVAIWEFKHMLHLKDVNVLGYCLCGHSPPFALLRPPPGNW